MAKMIYAAITSLDGYIEDTTGKFDWAMPDDEVHKYINDQERAIGTHLLGRRMYETMAGWETFTDLPPVEAEYAGIWKAADKIVYSRTLGSASTARTRIEREFDPEAVRRLLEKATHDVSVGGPELAAHVFKAGLVDECHLYIAPVIVGGGKPTLPQGAFLRLALLGEHHFASGMVHLRYRMLK